jgi:hypothetical protein
VGALGVQKGTAYAITISWNTSSDSLSVDFPSFCPIGRLQRAFTMRLSERRKVCLLRHGKSLILNTKRHYAGVGPCRPVATREKRASSLIFARRQTIQPTSLMNSTRVGDYA